MDKAERLQQEAEVELNRMSKRHNEEWDEILLESQQALESATTVKEIKATSKEYERKFRELRKRQKEETIQLQEEFIDQLLSL